MQLEEPRTLGYGIAASLAVHLLLLVIFALWTGMSSLRPLAKPVMETEPQVTLLFPDAIQIAPPPEPAPQPVLLPREPAKPYIRTTQNTEEPIAPQDPKFISDRNTVASSRLAADPQGTDPLPTTNGIDRPMLELANRSYKEGEIKNDSALQTPPRPIKPPLIPRPASPQRAASAPLTPTPVDPNPMFKAPEPSLPKPEMKANLVKKEDSPAEKSLRDFDETLKTDGMAAPPPKSKNPREAPPADDQPPKSLPNQEKSATPATPAEQRPVPKAIAVPAQPMMTAPRPEEDVFQPETRVSKTKGTINNIGLEDAVDAIATVTGKYKRQVTSAIEQKWHLLRRQKADFLGPGELRLRFYVDKTGKINPADISILFNHANPIITDFTLTAILQAEIPPMPKDLLPNFENGRMEMEYDIVIH